MTKTQIINLATIGLGLLSIGMSIVSLLINRAIRRTLREDAESGF